MLFSIFASVHSFSVPLVVAGISLNATVWVALPTAVLLSAAQFLAPPKSTRRGTLIITLLITALSTQA